MRNLIFILLTISLTIKSIGIVAQTPLTEAVDFTATDTDGQVWNLFDELDQGKYVLIDFFLTTCPNCVASVPHIQESFEYFGCGDFDVRYFGINYGETDLLIKEFNLAHGLTYPSISGVDGGGNQIVLDYEIQVAPTVILIAPDHSIVLQSIWPIDNAQMLIDELEVFEIEENECIADPLQASFEVNNSDPCLNELIQFFSTSTGDIDAYYWTFENGFPAHSSAENPLVNYDATGTFDVSLTVSSGFEENTIVMENLITVHNCTGIDHASAKDFSITRISNSENYQIEFPTSENYSIEIFDVSGKQVHSAEAHSHVFELNLSLLKTGVYVVSISNTQDEFRKKIILNH